MAAGKRHYAAVDSKLFELDPKASEEKVKEYMGRELAPFGNMIALQVR